MKKHYRHETDCLNCGADLQGHFCHVCGQENLQMKESFGHMLNHAVSDYFHFDYQFFHTLKPLFAKPGKLTVDYLAGRRMQYLHPVKMYIFISLVFFVLFFRQSGDQMVKINKGKESGKLLKDTIQKNLLANIDSDSSLSATEKQKAKAVVSNFLPGAVKKALPDSAKNAPANKSKKAITAGDADSEAGDFAIFSNDDDPKTYVEYLAIQSKLPEAKRDNFLMRYIKKKGYDWKRQGKNAKEMFVEGLKHNTPKMMFVMLPLFAFILSIAFWKNKKFYVEHVIYAIHLHCFIFLFLAATIIIKLILPDSWVEFKGWIDFATFIAIIYYVYRSLRVVYNRSRWRTVSKMVGVYIMYMLVFCICFFAAAAITAITSV